jgi:hypothetical protein
MIRIKENILFIFNFFLSTNLPIKYKNGKKDRFLKAIALDPIL